MSINTITFPCFGGVIKFTSGPVFILFFQQRGRVCSRKLNGLRCEVLVQFGCRHLKVTVFD